jgi:hypothetical protein
MSKYAERHQHAADCSYCDKAAVKLALIDGTPYWLCPEHFEQHERKMSA